LADARRIDSGNAREIEDNPPLATMEKGLWRNSPVSGARKGSSTVSTETPCLTLPEATVGNSEDGPASSGTLSGSFTRFMGLLGFLEQLASLR
jgi:hypothetical protein